MKLNEAQNLFKKNLLAAQADPQSILHLKPAGTISLSQAFEIYHQSYLNRLTDKLKKTFTAVNWVLGQEIFEKASHRFIESQPSITYNLLNYGKSFPEFLQIYPATRHIPFLSDLARFEWIYEQIFHSAYTESMPVERIYHNLHAVDFKVQFKEGMAVFKSPYSIYEMWYRREEPPYNFEEIDWTHPESLLIFKKRRGVEVLQIENIEAEIILALQDDLSMTTVLADFANHMNPDRTARFFQLIMRAGIIEDIFILED